MGTERTGQSAGLLPGGVTGRWGWLCLCGVLRLALWVGPGKVQGTLATQTVTSVWQEPCPCCAMTPFASGQSSAWGKAALTW